MIKFFEIIDQIFSTFHLSLIIGDTKSIVNAFTEMAAAELVFFWRLRIYLSR